MKFSKSLILLALFGGLTLLTVAQSTDDGVRWVKSRLLDVPSARFKLEAGRNGTSYGFCNSSPIRVVSSRLGCVEKKSGGLKILVERPLENVDLDPPNGSIQSCSYADCSDCSFPGGECKKGKLAVIEVNLADGTTWKLR
jgi:hypothetical protein